jgi:phosphoesterase RecJ-like protein
MEKHSSTTTQHPPWGQGYHIPVHRVPPLRKALAALEGAHEVILTTHVNADGDGAGCQAALASWLRSRRKVASILNPTPFPETFEFLLEDRDWLVDPGSARASTICQGADLALVLDTGESPRLGRVKSLIDPVPKLVIDHHPPGGRPIEGISLRDPSACAAGELVYDLFLLADGPWSLPMANGVYVAIMTDTGSFRYSNASPESHRIAADLLAFGVDPERIYRKVFASYSPRRFQLLEASLRELEVDSDGGVAWMTVPQGAFESLRAESEDLDGFVEYPRALRGVEVALLFRTTRDGSTKVSFRSTGRVDVNVLARRFGGGGHAKAAGAVVGGPVEEVRAKVVASTREVIRDQRGRRERQ